MYSWITPNGESMMCWPFSREDVFPKPNEAYTSKYLNRIYFYACT